MTDNLTIWEQQKIHKALTKTKEEHKFNFRIIKSTENFNFIGPLLKTKKLGLIRLAVYYSSFNVNKRNHQFV